MLYTLIAQKLERREKLSSEEISSLIYHDIFDYPLTLAELIKWEAGAKISPNHKPLAISRKSGYYFLSEREGLIYKRLLRQRISERKLQIAKKAAKILSFIPTVKMVGLTGALAMQNSDEGSDIDLLIITQKGTLWTSRLITLIALIVLRIPTRKFGDKNQKDKLCLNMWMEETDLLWDRKDRNIYTAHEIAQIVPLVNKDNTYEKFLWKNKWILEYWPNSVRVTELHSDKVTKKIVFLVSGTLYLCNYVTLAFEKIAFKFQYLYMRKKITREVITRTRALFHPNDWGKFVLTRLNGILYA